MRSLVKALALYFLIPFAISAQPIWEVQNSGVTANLHAVSFCNAMVGTAVGDSGVIVHTTNGGKLWVSQHSGDSLQLNGIAQLDSLDAVAVGLKGNIIRTDDGGKTWRLVLNNNSDDIYAITFRNRLSGIAVGDNGFASLTNDGGSTWNLSKQPYGRMETVTYATDSNIFVAGGSVGGESNDGGLTWGNYFRIGYFNNSDGVESHVNKIIFKDSMDGWASGTQFWLTGFPNPVPNWAFILFRSKNGGDNWINYPVAGSNPDAVDIFCIDFIYDTLCIGVDNYGHLYQIFTNGDVNTYPMPTNKASSSLCVIQDSDVYIVGDSGVILHFIGIQQPTTVFESPAQSPFFFLSQNYPNPFGSAPTMISYTLQSSGMTRLKVYDLLGEEVAAPVNGWQAAGTHSVLFNALRLPEGAYLYRLQEGSSSQTKIMYVER